MIYFEGKLLKIIAVFTFLASVSTEMKAEPYIIHNDNNTLITLHTETVTVLNSPLRIYYKTSTSIKGRSEIAVFDNHINCDSPQYFVDAINLYDKTGRYIKKEHVNKRANVIYKNQPLYELYSIYCIN